MKLTKFLEEHILKPFMCNKLFSCIQNCENVICIFGANIAGLKEYFHLSQVLALLQQRDGVILAPAGTLLVLSTCEILHLHRYYTIFGEDTTLIKQAFKHGLSIRNWYGQ